LAQLLERSNFLDELENGYKGTVRAPVKSNPTLGVFATGSAVIASEKRMSHVAIQHRKVNGIDMELYGFHRAVELSGQKVISFSSKVVVDNGDKKKADSLQEYGSYISAKFTVEALKVLLQ
jgi:hypothetical protein